MVVSGRELFRGRSGPATGEERRMARGDRITPTHHSRSAIAAIVVTTMLFAGMGVAWALNVSRQRAVSVSASYTIKVGVDESHEQLLFRVGDAVVGTECFAGQDPPETGVFSVGGKALTVTNTGSDPIMVWDVEGLGTVGSGGPAVIAPGDSEAFGLVGVGTTVNDPGFGGLLPITILDQHGRSASGTYSFWYEAKAPADGTCVISAQMRG